MSGPSWTTGDKDSVGTAVADASRVWFTTATGVLTEVFYPAPDQPCLRLLELIVTDGAGFVSAESTGTLHAPSVPDDQAPIGAVVNTCARGRYTIAHETIADPLSDVVLHHVRFTPAGPGLRLFVVVEPRLGALGPAHGGDNVAELGVHKGAPMLLASAPGAALAVAASVPILAATAGVLGADGRAQLAAGGALATRVERAGPGFVALTAELDVAACAGDFVLALGLAAEPAMAAHLAHGSLHRGFAASRALFVAQWHAWHATLAPPPAPTPRLWARSATILKTLEAKHPHSGRVAGLSLPWGGARGPETDGTYALVWTRDMVESVGALLAMGAGHEARHAAHYLRTTQEADGHWPQNMRLDGAPAWNNDELDETALPVAFLHLVERQRWLVGAELASHWPMLRAAAGYIARSGPQTTRDRWEDTSGVTPFTLANAIVALLVASELADRAGEALAATVLRDLADQWNANIEPWLYRAGGALAEHVGVPGYYVRARIPGQPFAALPDLANLPPTELGVDALALVRCGLRAADDPRIESTVRVIDALLKVDLPGGPAWRRYASDRYGEHPDGAAFSYDDASRGRAWPLLTGERAHYELARGHRDEARALLAAMESFANATGHLPEQVWDQPDLPARGLWLGRPSHSAAPLGWAHGEYVKLARSLADGRVFDLPPHAVTRYLDQNTRPAITTWRVGEPAAPTVGALRVVCLAPAVIEWRGAAGAAPQVLATRDTGLGLYVADLAGRELRVTIRHREARPGDGAELVFTAGA